MKNNDFQVIFHVKKMNFLFSSKSSNFRNPKALEKEQKQKDRRHARRVGQIAKRNKKEAWLARKVNP